ncbi:16573_t:CDS:2, partial [Funneliformis caledonium]
MSKVKELKQEGRKRDKEEKKKYNTKTDKVQAKYGKYGTRWIKNARKTSRTIEGTTPMIRKEEKKKTRDEKQSDIE